MCLRAAGRLRPQRSRWTVVLGPLKPVLSSSSSRPRGRRASCALSLLLRFRGSRRGRTSEVGQHRRLPPHDAAASTCVAEVACCVVNACVMARASRFTAVTCRCWPRDLLQSQAHRPPPGSMVGRARRASSSASNSSSSAASSGPTVPYHRRHRQDVVPVVPGVTVVSATNAVLVVLKQPGDISPTADSPPSRSAAAAACSAGAAPVPAASAGVCSIPVTLRSDERLKRNFRFPDVVRKTSFLDGGVGLNRGAAGAVIHCREPSARLAED